MVFFCIDATYSQDRINLGLFFGKSGLFQSNRKSEQRIEMQRAAKYAADGVNLQEGDSFSAFCADVCRRTYEFSPFLAVRDWSRGQFRGPRTFRLYNLSPECELSADPDGNGTKVIITSTADTPEECGKDLFAMTGMDGVRYGGRNVLLVNQLDTSSLGSDGDATNRFFRRAVAGLGSIAAHHGVVLLKGETAEMGVCVSSENPNAPKFLWCGVMLSVYHPNAFITGEGLQSGQICMALREYGLRANGGSSARKAFALQFGKEWYANPEAQEHIRAAAEPSVLYEEFLSSVNGWNTLDNGAPVPRLRMHAIAHITGGGIPSKLFGDILKPRGLSAELSDLWEPPAIMCRFAEWRGVSGREAYEIWHGGQGAIVVLDEENVPQFTLLAEQYGIEARAAGHIANYSTPALRIHSKFDGKVLTWE